MMIPCRECCALFALVTVTVLLSLTCPCESVGPLPNGEWCYWEDPECDPNTWTGECEIGPDQSPIDLEVPAVNGTGHIFTHNALNRLNFFYGRELLRYTSFSLLNTGHTAQFTLPMNANPPVFMEPFLPDKGERYALAQGHFHWGLSKKNGINGSEHAINGKFYGGELHLVHYAEKYGSFANAVAIAPSDPHAVLVIAILLDITVGPNPYLEPIIRRVPEIYDYDPNLNMKTFSGLIELDKIFPPNLDFFRYQGSLTSPPCSEQVLFFVMKTPIPISNKQLAVFREVEDIRNLDLLENFRNLQPRNGRQVDFYKVHQTYNLFWGVPLAWSYMLGSIWTLITETFNFSGSFPSRILGTSLTNVTQPILADLQQLFGIESGPQLGFKTLFTIFTQLRS